MNIHIEVKNGIITAINNIPNGVTINIDGAEEKYANGFAFPGFTDHHGHVAALGKKITGVPLNNCRSADECIELLKANAQSRGGWIVEFGWNNERFPDNFYPAKEILDDAFPDNPVYLVRIDGHSAWVNSAALTIAGIDNHTPSPFGGIIEKNKAGQPTGILIDNAMNLITNLIPAYSDAELEKMIAIAIKELAANGISTANDMDVDNQAVEIYKSMAESGKLHLKINAFVKAQQNEWLEKATDPFAIGKLNVCGLKFFADGALGSRGAALKTGYKDSPANKGLLLITENELYAKAERAVEKGWTIAVHAIGDAANKLVIDAYARLRRAKITTENAALRIEHAQILSAEDVERIAENNIIASVQPIHCTSDVPMAVKRLNAAALANSYRWKSLINAGITIIGGSDFPIESHNPLLGIDAFVNRIPEGDEKAWNADERLTIGEAIDCYVTANAGIADGEDAGSIKIGGRADITILSHDIRNIDTNKINDATVLATYCDGKKVFESKLAKYEGQ